MPKKRADGRYARQITIGKDNSTGKPIKKTIYGKTIKELDQNEREFRNLLEKGLSTATDNITVDTLIDIWLKSKKTSVSKSSMQQISTQTRKLSSYIGKMKVKDVKLFHIENIINELSENVSNVTINLFLIRVKEIFKYACEKDMIYKSPAQFVKLLKTGESKKRAMTEHEKSLFDIADFTDMQYCFLNILRYTGMRKGEVLALTRQDIDLSNKKISVCKTVIDNSGKPYIKQSTKTDSQRTIPILEPLYPIIKEYCDNRIGLLFPNGKGKPISNQSFNYIWEDIIKRLTIANENKTIPDGITPHLFRHTFASDLYDAGIDIKRAQYMLGHKNIKTTLDVYTHFDKNKVKADEMNSYYRQSKDSQLVNFGKQNA
jgi:integrase